VCFDRRNAKLPYLVGVHWGKLHPEGGLHQYTCVKNRAMSPRTGEGLDPTVSAQSFSHSVLGELRFDNPFALAAVLVRVVHPQFSHFGHSCTGILAGPFGNPLHQSIGGPSQEGLFLFYRQGKVVLKV
jgi:hypothetical protein